MWDLSNHQGMGGGREGSVPHSKIQSFIFLNSLQIRSTMQVVAARLTSPLGLTEVPYNWLGCSQVNLKGEGRGGEGRGGGWDL